MVHKNSSEVIKKLCYTPIIHPRFTTTFLSRSEVKELRMQWELYNPTEDAVRTEKVIKERGTPRL